jgi:hypothetical protein
LFSILIIALEDFYSTHVSNASVVKYVFTTYIGLESAINAEMRTRCQLIVKYATRCAAQILSRNSSQRSNGDHWVESLKVRLNDVYELLRTGRACLRSTAGGELKPSNGR